MIGIPHSRFNVLLIAVILSHLLVQRPSSLRAQVAPQKPKRQTSTTIKEAGRVHSVDRGLIRMISHKGERWEVKVTATTKIKLLGSVGPSALRIGTPVRFYAKLDRRGAGHERLEELAIFSIDENYVPLAELQQEENELPLGGINLDSAGEGGMGKAEETEPALEKTARESKSTQKKTPRVNPSHKSYFVVGVIRRIQRDRLTVDVGQGRSVTVRVAKTAKVHLDSKDYSLARAGAPINIVARYYYKPGQATASEVTILFNDKAASSPKGRRGSSRQAAKVSEKTKRGSEFNVAKEVEKEKRLRGKKKEPEKNKEAAKKDE